MAICESDAADKIALEVIQSLFPNLMKSDHELTSPPTAEYNCIAFVTGDLDCRWWPLQFSADFPVGAYWPRRIPRENTRDAFRQLFESHSFQACTNANFEFGFEKIALYSDSSGKPTHAARQIFEGQHQGQWKSKIGKLADIRHAKLEALEGEEYGDVTEFYAPPITP